MTIPVGNNISLYVVSVATNMRNKHADNALTWAGRRVTAEAVYLVIPFVGLIEYLFHFCVGMMVAPVNSKIASKMFENAGVALFVGTTYAPKCAFANFFYPRLRPPSVVV